MVDKHFLADIFYIPGSKKTPTKTRTWYYQFPGGQVQAFTKEGGYWFYYDDTPGIKKGFSGETGCDTLAGAKGDVLYAGGKVWSELK